MAPAEIAKYEFTPRFQREYKKAPVDVRAAVNRVFADLRANPAAHRCHNLKGYKPTVYAADVLSNHSWQLTFEMSGTTAVLRRLASHQEIDRAP